MPSELKKKSCPVEIVMNLHRKCVFQNHAPRFSRKHTFDFYQFSWQWNEHANRICRHLFRFWAPQELHSRPWLVHIYDPGPLLQSLLCTKTLHFYLNVCFMTRLQVHLSEFSWFCTKMLPALGGEHYFASLPSLGGGLNSPPNAYRELLLSTWQAISRPIILLPAAAGSIISIFEQKRTKQIPFSFPSFPVLENQCAFFLIFSSLFKKKKNASCIGAEHIFERHVHELSCPPLVFTPTWRASNWLCGTPLSLTKYKRAIAFWWHKAQMGLHRWWHAFTTDFNANVWHDPYCMWRKIRMATQI